MAFTKRIWAQNGLRNRPQIPDFVDFVQLSHKNASGLPSLLLQKLAFTKKNWLFAWRLMDLFVHSLVLRFQTDPAEARPPSVRTTTEQSTAQQKWYSLCTSHSEELSAKLNAKCDKACSYVHLFLPNQKDMYKLGKTCGVK